MHLIMSLHSDHPKKPYWMCPWELRSIDQQKTLAIVNGNDNCLENNGFYDKSHVASINVGISYVDPPPTWIFILHVPADLKPQVSAAPLEDTVRLFCSTILILGT